MDLDTLIAKYELINKHFDHKFPKLRGDVKTLARLGKITEELGELNSAVHGELKLHRPEKQAAHRHQDVEDEWADVFNTVMLFGLTVGIDMPEAIEHRLKEIYRRLEL